MCFVVSFVSRWTVAAQRHRVVAFYTVRMFEAQWAVPGGSLQFYIKANTTLYEADDGRHKRWWRGGAHTRRAGAPLLSLPFAWRMCLCAKSYTLSVMVENMLCTAYVERLYMYVYVRLEGSIWSEWLRQFTGALAWFIGSVWMCRCFAKTKV